MTDRQQLFKFNLKTRGRTTSNNLKKLMKRRRNYVPKSYLKRRLAHFSNLIKAVDNDRLTMLDLSSKKNYFELIYILEKSGCSVDVKKSFSRTLLSTALFSNNLEAMNFLTDANVDFSTNNNCERVLKTLKTLKNILPVSTLTAFMRKMKSCSKDLKSMARLLVEINCPLTFVVYASDALLTEAVLQMPDYEINEEDFMRALKHMIEQIDFENLRVLWRSDRLIESRYNLLNRMWNPVTDEDWRHMRPLFEHLTDWVVLDRDFLAYLDEIFLRANKYQLHVLLYEYNIDVQLRQKYNVEVLPLMFGNENLDVEDLADIVHKRKFNVNAMSFRGITALHYAGMFGLDMNVRLLLELGADCNGQTDRLATPLFHTSNASCVKLLLHYGLDMHLANKSGEIAAEYILGPMYSDEDLSVNNLLLDQLAIDEYRGVPIKQTIFDKIDCKQICLDYFESSLEQVKKIWTHGIDPSLMLFDIITKKPEKIANQIYCEEIISAITEWCNEQSLHSYYCSLLEFKLQKAYDIYQAKCRIASIISKDTSNPISFDHLVVDTICDFLSYRDVLMVVSV